MKWFEYQMEVDQLHAPDALKARLLAMQPDTPTSQEHSTSAAPAPKGKAVRFPHWRRWAAGIAACAAVAVVGSQALVAMGPAGAGISTMSLMAGGAASSTAAAYDAAAPEADNDTVNIWNRDIYAWPTKMIVAAKRGYTTRIPFTASAEVKEQARGVFF